MCVCQQINTPQRETVRQMAASNNCPDSNHNSFNFFFDLLPLKGADLHSV